MIRITGGGSLIPLTGDPLRGKEYQVSIHADRAGLTCLPMTFDGDGDNDIYTAAAAHGYGLTMV